MADHNVAAHFYKGLWLLMLHGMFPFAGRPAGAGLA
jgi:hypothetical protein